MKITLHSAYNNFTTGQEPKYIKWTDGQQLIHCYVNEYVKKINVPVYQSIAIIIEPRSILPDVYTWIEKYYYRYKYIFTHDAELLKKENAHILTFGGVWDWSDVRKTKDFSMISSNKKMCPLHIERMNLARKLEGKVDCFGTYKGKWISTYDAHAEYRFAVVIENYINDYWFTEKICNCFAAKTVPIYYGAKQIGSYFDADGIIQADIKDIPKIINEMDPEAEYEKRLTAINNNYEIVKNYQCFEDTFYRQYQALLEGMEHDIINHYSGIQC